jgi:hypothetical protein
MRGWGEKKEEALVGIVRFARLMIYPLRETTTFI